MTSTTARVAAVNTLPLGSILTVAALLGATTLAVEDAADFDEAGGVVIIGGTEIVTYTAADDAAGTLTLATPTAAAWDVDTRIELWDTTGATRVVETVAQVLVEGVDQSGDSLEAVVDHALIPFLPEGIRETDPETGLVGEAVAIEWRGDELVVVNIIGQAPVMDGSMIDPTTLPPGVTPETPSTPAAPTVLGGISSLLVRWDAITHINPVTYAVYVSDTTPVVPSATTFVGEVTGTQLTVRRIPVPNVELGTPDSPLLYETVYYAALVAKDSVDPTYVSPTSAEGSGSPVQATAGDLAADSVTAEQIVAGSITGESFSGEVILGSRIATANAGQRVEIDPAGVRLFNSADELRVNLPTDPAQDPSFRGRVEADGLTVRQGAQFFSTLNEFAKDSRISLAEQVAAPVAAPDVSMTWGAVQLEQRAITGPLGTFSLDYSQIRSAAWHPTLSRFIVSQYRPGLGTRLWYYDLSGMLAALSPNPIVDYADNWDVVGFGYDTAGEIRALFQYQGGDYWIYDPTRPAGSQTREYVRQNSARRPTLFVDGSNDIYVVEQSTGGPTIFRRVTTNTSPVTVAGAVTVSGVADANWAPVFGYRGNADFGTARYLTAGRNAESYRVFATGGSYQAAEAFPPPVSRAAAFWAPGGTARFMTIGTDGRLYMHSNIAWTSSADDTWHLAQTFYDNQATGGTHETLVGAVRTFTMTKRANVRVTLSQVPYAGGTDDPNRWRVYGKRGTAPGTNGSGTTLQAEGAYTTTQYTQAVVLTTSGAAPPSSSNFPGATPAKLVSARAMPGDPSKPIVEIRGDGSGRWGPLEFDGDGTYSASYDTGWVTITPAAGSSGTLAGRRVGNAVYLRGTVLPGASWVVDTDKTLVSSLPTQFQPSLSFRFVAAPSAASGDLYFNTSVGSTIVARANRTAGATAVYFALTYLAD